MNRGTKKKQALFTVEQAINASKWDKRSTWASIINKSKNERPEPEKRRSNNN